MSKKLTMIRLTKDDSNWKGVYSEDAQTFAKRLAKMFESQSIKHKCKDISLHLKGIIEEYKLNHSTISKINHILRNDLSVRKPKMYGYCVRDDLFGHTLIVERKYVEDEISVRMGSTGWMSNYDNY